MTTASGADTVRPDDIVEPAWVWDLDRACIVDANGAALAFWDEPAHADLLERPFDPAGPLAANLKQLANRLEAELADTVLPLPLASGTRSIRCELSHFSLKGGRRGLLIKVLGEASASDGDHAARLAAAAFSAPIALMTVNVAGSILSENEASEDLFGRGREMQLAQRLGSSRITNALIEETLIHGRAGRSRSLLTRFGPRMCRLTTRRNEDPVTRRPAILVQAVDVEDQRARDTDLAAENEALSDFLGASVDIYFELDFDLRIVRGSPGLAEKLHLASGEIGGTHWRDITGQNGLSTSREIDLAMGARSGWRDEVCSITNSDARITFETNGRVLTNDRGDFRGYRIVGRQVDTPAAGSAEVTPLQSRALERTAPTAFAEMMSSAPWGVAVHRDFAPVYLNSAFTEIFGLEDDVLREPGDVPLLRFFPGNQQALREDYERLMTDELAFAVRELDARRLDNREVTLQMRARRIDWQGASAIEYVLEDVSAYRQKSEPRDEHAAFFDAALHMVPEAVLLMRGNGLVDWANLAALRLLGLPDTGPSPHDISDVLCPEDTGWAQDYIAGLAKGGLTRLFADGREVTVVNAGGERVPALMAIDRIEVGDATRVCAVFRDISEWRRAEGKVEEAREDAASSSERKTEFLAKVSHELRTPLTAILGFAQVMAKEELGPIGNARYVEYANDILNSGDHLMSLINDLLDMSKVETGKLDLSFDSVDLQILAEDCARLMSPVAGSRQITLRAAVPEGLPPVVADERSLRQILLNLISNALRFTDPGGEVRITAAPDARGGLTLSVIDTGVGMDEQELTLALEPFEQVDKAVANGTPGTGLGLPIAKALTEANRATFSIESTPEAGTTVSITFPSTQVLAE